MQAVKMDILQTTLVVIVSMHLCLAGKLNIPSARNGSGVELRSVIGVPVGPGQGNYWPYNTIPYVIDPSMTAEDITNLKAAIADYHNKTCLQWVPRQTEEAYVRFVRNLQGSGCAYADNCYTGGERVVTMENCNGRDTFIHEMGHTLCYGHEQDRNDKDEFVTDCSTSKYEHLNFGHLYDYRSIMHYRCGDCLVPKMAGVSKEDCGSPNGLSVLDAEKINDIYRCRTCGKAPHRFRFPFELDPDDRENKLIVGGNETSGQTLYVCRAYIRGDIVSGKASIWNDKWTCWVGWGGVEHRIENIEEFEVLTSQWFINVHWARWNNGKQVPYYAIPGGRTVSAETMYIGRCRVTIDGKQVFIPGKIHANNPTYMFYTYGGREFKCTDMQLLVCRAEGIGK